MAFRARYWNCGPFAAWVRQTFGGYHKPKLATAEEWQRWQEEMSSAHPRVFWFTEVFLKKIQTVLYWPLDCLDNLTSYVANRWTDRIHWLPTGLKPGAYYEVDTRLLHGLFETFCDFIESEKAWTHLIAEGPKGFSHHAILHYRFPWLSRWMKFRCPEAGLARLMWEMALDEENADQAASARQQMELYRWWREVRPARLSPWEASECAAIAIQRPLTLYRSLQETMDARYADTDYEAAVARMEALEAEYAREDQAMMIALIRIRGHLVT